MTCFWNGLLSRLSINEINDCLHVRLGDKPHPSDFVHLLQKNIVRTIDVTCGENGDTQLSNKLLDENYEWIINYDVAKIYDGHDCSTCDPFLLLVSQLFTIDIYHNYDKCFVKYVNIKNKSGRILSLSSNRGHLW